MIYSFQHIRFHSDKLPAEQNAFNMRISVYGLMYQRVAEADWMRFMEIVRRVVGDPGMGPTEGGADMVIA